MLKYILLIAIAISNLFVHPVLYAENTLNSEKLTAYPWFNGIEKDQKVWLKSAVKHGLKYQLPVQVKFFSLSETLDIYQTAELKQLLKSYPAIPSVIVYKGGEYSEGDSATNWGDITLHEFKSGRTGRVKITYKEITGWIKRSEISMHSIIITTQTGNYLRDIIPGYRAAGGSSARFTVESKNDSCYLVVRYNGNRRLKDEKYFGFHYDVESNQLLDVVRWDPARVSSVKQKPLKELVTTRVINKLNNQIGFGKTGFLTTEGGQSDGQLYKPKIFYGLIDEKTPTIRIGQYLVINSSHY